MSWTLNWLLFPAVGALAGTLAGLFGIGGGLVIVPVMNYVLAAQGVDYAVCPLRPPPASGAIASIRRRGEPAVTETRSSMS